MKLVFAIVNDKDGNKVMSKLNEKGLALQNFVLQEVF